MASEHHDWRIFYFASGGAGGVLVSGIENPTIKKFDGKTIAQIAAEQRKIRWRR